jgi:hypothetical protein
MGLLDESPDDWLAPIWNAAQNRNSFATGVPWPNTQAAPLALMPRIAGLPNWARTQTSDPFPASSDGAGKIPDNGSAYPSGAPTPAAQTRLEAFRNFQDSGPNSSLPPRSVPSGSPIQRADVIPLCWYSSDQPNRRHGIVTCNYRCYDDGGDGASKTYEYGTDCPRLIRRPY